MLFILPVDALDRAKVHGFLDFIFGTVKTDDLSDIHAFLVTEAVGAGFGTAAAGNAFVLVDIKFSGHLHLLGG